MRLIVSGVFSVLAVALLCSSGTFGQDKQKPKYSIKQVMKDAHKSGLMKKVADGNASEAEKKKLLEFYLALSLNKSPAGEDDAWKKTTTTLVKLAESIAKGEGEAAKLAKAANCKSCHDVHKK